MQEAEIREEFERRTLRRRKMELGTGFFAPAMLRAIMIYNTALQRSIDEEVMTSQDWGRFARPEAPDEADAVPSAVNEPELTAPPAEAIGPGDEAPAPGDGR